MNSYYYVIADIVHIKLRFSRENEKIILDLEIINNKLFCLLLLLLLLSNITALKHIIKVFISNMWILSILFKKSQFL